MPRVVLTSGLAQVYTSGETEIEVPGSNVRQLLKALDERYPGLGEQIRESMAIAIDGEIYQDAMFETVDDSNEIFIMPKIGGG